MCTAIEEFDKNKEVNTTIGKYLNKGKYGSIYIADGNTNLVWKVQNTKRDKRVTREANALAMVSGHSHIVQIRCFLTNQVDLRICMNRVHGKELFDEVVDGTLSVANIHTITHQLTSAISFIHSKGVVHRDIKCENVMIERIGQSVRAVLIDFGEAKLVDVNTLMHSNVGSPSYISYEIAHGFSYTSKCDIWSFGVTIYTMWFMVFPFSNNTDIQNRHYQDEDSAFENSQGFASGYLNAYRGDVPSSILTLFKKHIFVPEEKRFDSVQLLGYFKQNTDIVIREKNMLDIQLFPPKEQTIFTL